MVQRRGPSGQSMLYQSERQSLYARSIRNGCDCSEDTSSGEKIRCADNVFVNVFLILNATKMGLN